MVVDRRSLPPAERAARRERVRRRAAQRATGAFSPAAYWERRYKGGGDSGAGSRGAAAERKAAYINSVLAREDVVTVVDWGCGDGQQLALLDLTGVHYTGIDVSPTALSRCKQQCPEQAYLLWRGDGDLAVTADVALSVDVLFHLPDDRGYHAYLDCLFASAARYVLIHSTTYDAPPKRHIRRRAVTDDIARRFPGWKLVDRAPGVGECEFMLYRAG